VDHVKMPNFISHNERADPRPDRALPLRDGFRDFVREVQVVNMAHDTQADAYWRRKKLDGECSLRVREITEGDVNLTGGKVSSQVKRESSRGVRFEAAVFGKPLKHPIKEAIRVGVAAKRTVFEVANPDRLTFRDQGEYVRRNLDSGLS
jgi:hypothetical protein